MGDPQRAWDEDRVRQAAELGGASGFIGNLPDGFDTMLHPPGDIYSGEPESTHETEYKHLRRRVRLTQDPKFSGGQMQKLALYALLYSTW
jgi:ABC-type multidrug transport system fused ATPase/permease subunit